MTGARTQSPRVASVLLSLVVAGGLSAGVTPSAAASEAGSAAATAVGGAVVTQTDPRSPGSLTGSCDSSLHASAPFTGVPWAQKRLQLKRAHEFATGRLVSVAVVDTGVDTQNPQLAQSLDRAKHPASFVPPDVDSVPPSRDCDGHGTFVAGIIAARPSPGVSLVGVAPNARILPVRVTKGAAEGSANDLAAGIDYAVEQGVDIINVSIVTGTPNHLLRAAVAHALQNGVVVVAAAGNTGGQTNNEVWPAGFADEKGLEGLIVVGATGQSGALAPFSTTSVPVSVVAPGDDIWSTAPIQGQQNDKGTSFAAPFVSGVAALVLEAYDKKLTPVQVKRRLELTADLPGRDVPDPGYGYGTVNPFQAVTAILSDRQPARRAAHSGPAIKRVAVEEPADPTTRHVAMGVAAGGLLIALMTLGAVATYRRGRARQWKPGG